MMAERRAMKTDLDQMLAEAGLTRSDVATAFCVSRQRVGQIFSGRGVSYQLADDLQRYINRAAGRMVCRNEHFIAHRKETSKKRR
jgi:hypothetical protein